MRKTALLPASFLIACQILAQQSSPSNPEQQKQTKQNAEERCSIEGLVLKAGADEPLKRALVLLRKRAASEMPYALMTDAAGRFAFKDIEPGQYDLSVDRHGYVAQDYGQKTPDGPGAILTLEPGKQLKDVTFRLIPTAVITGRVTDEDGEPIPGVSIEALSLTYDKGKKQFADMARAETNDLGEYRIFDLRPGRYFISATSNFRFNYFRRPTASVKSNEKEEEYVPTYYPGTNDSERATPIDVHPGDEIPSVDFALLPTKSYRLRGRVVNTLAGHGGKAGRVVVNLERRDAAFRYGRIAEAVEDPDGKFELRGIAPGAYTLNAYWYDEENDKSYGDSQPVDISNSNVDGITLVIAAGATLNGHLSIEGKSQGSSDLRVYLESESRRNYRSSSGGLVKPDGTFIIKNISDGTYHVDIAGAPADSYLKSASIGGDDVLNSPLTISGGNKSGKLEVVLSMAAAVIEGRVLTAEDLPASAATVVLVPEPPGRGVDRLYKDTTTDQFGRFILRGIAPGEYKLFAWEKVESGAWRDAAFLQPFEDQGQQVKFDEGARQSIELKSIPAETPVRNP